MKLDKRVLQFGMQWLFYFTLAGFALLAFQGDGVDFRGYYGAAELITRGGNPYNYSELAPILEEITGFQGNNPYFYPPWYAVLFVPLTIIPFQAARFVWLLLNVVMFYWGLENVRRSLSDGARTWKDWGLYFVATLLFAVICLVSEQAGIFLFLGLSFVLRFLKQEQPAVVGLGLVMLATKPQVTLFACIYLTFWLLFHRRRAFYWSVGWFLILLVFSAIVMPEWWQINFTNFGQGIFYELDGPETIAYTRVNSTVFDFTNSVLGLKPPIQTVAVAMIGVFGAILVWLARKQSPHPAMVSAATLLLTLLITPYALQYDYVPLTLVLFLCAYHWQQMSLLSKTAVLGLWGFTFSVLIWQTWSYQGYWALLGILFAFYVLILDGGKSKESSEFHGI